MVTHEQSTQGVDTVVKCLVEVLHKGRRDLLGAHGPLFVVFEVGGAWYDI